MNFKNGTDKENLNPFICVLRNIFLTLLLQNISFRLFHFQEYMVLILEEKKYGYGWFVEAYRRRKAELLTLSLTPLLQGLQNGLICDQVVNKMSLEQFCIINMGFHFLVYFILKNTRAIPLLRINIYCLHYLYGLGHLVFAVSTKDTVLPFVCSGFPYFLLVYNIYVYLKFFTTPYIKFSMS